MKERVANEIIDAFNNKGNAVKKIEELKLSDVNFNEDIELLKRLIDS